jgi:hypothetical protein
VGGDLEVRQVAQVEVQSVAQVKQEIMMVVMETQIRAQVVVVRQQHLAAIKLVALAVQVL